VIYLNCHTTTVGDISELWHEDLGGRPFGAVEMKFEMGADGSRRDFGVLLIDCEKFEKSKILDRAMDFARRAASSFHDRDVMDARINGDGHASLSPRYDFIPLVGNPKKCIEKFGTPIVIHHACVEPWKLSASIAKFFHKFGLFKYSASILMSFWAFAAASDADKKFFGEKKLRTLSFFCKMAGGAVASFVRSRASGTCHFLKNARKAKTLRRGER
jgi:lipopolysaccharide biosynthesis glycosyltransferase